MSGPGMGKILSTITERTDTNSQSVPPAPDRLLQENNALPSTTGSSSFNPRDIRKQIQAGVHAPAATPSDATRL